MATATAPTPASIGLTRPKTSLASSLWIPAYSLWRRELVRFYRQKARVVGVIASPLLFWLVLGSGFSKDLSKSRCRFGRLVRFHALFELLLSRRHHHDRALHRHLQHDVVDPGSQ